MKKFLLVLLMIFIIFPLFSEDSKKIEPEPYVEEEFSPILHDLRRSSVVFCGAFPLGYLYSSIILDPYLDSTDPFNGLTESEKSSEEVKVKLISSLLFSGVVVIIDFIIEKIFY